LEEPWTQEAALTKSKILRKQNATTTKNGRERDLAVATIISEQRTPEIGEVRINPESCKNSR
jgi:hypothetical protein